VALHWSEGSVEAAAGEVLHVPGGLRHEFVAVGERPAGLLACSLPSRRPATVGENELRPAE